MIVVHGTLFRALRFARRVLHRVRGLLGNERGRWRGFFSDHILNAEQERVAGYRILGTHLVREIGEQSLGLVVRANGHGRIAANGHDHDLVEGEQFLWIHFHAIFVLQ